MRAGPVAAVLMVSGAVICAGGAAAQLLRQGGAVPDQVWVGVIRCDPIPNVVRKPLVQRFRLDVQGGVARYDRAILFPDTSIESGHRERGQGAVAPNGALVLRGQGNGNASSYTSEYSGVLPQDSAAGRLTGVQHWQFRSLPPYDRACQITLRRGG